VTEYHVEWDIEVEADSHEHAAWRALEIQRDPNSIATVFEVSDGTVGPITIDVEPTDGTDMPGSHVWLAHIEHKHGDELSVHRSEESAWNEVYEWVATGWYAMYEPPGDLPTDHNEAISAYFEAMQEREWASVLKLKVYP
jgi:hypothetical protein